MVEVTDRVDSFAINRKLSVYSMVLAGYYFAALVVASVFPLTIPTLHVITAAILIAGIGLLFQGLDVWLQGHTTMRRFRYMALAFVLLAGGALLHIGLLFMMGSWGQLLLVPEVAIFVIGVFAFSLTRH